MMRNESRGNIGLPGKWPLKGFVYAAQLQAESRLTSRHISAFQH